MFSPNKKLLKKKIRQDIRNSRSKVSDEKRKLAGENVVKSYKSLLTKEKKLNKHKHVAIFLAMQEEIQTSELIQYFQEINKKLYLPILHPQLKRSLWFAEYKPKTSLVLNKVGILEPKFNAEEIIAPWELDLVIMPLVAFDILGKRVGMGGGFYDNSFKFSKKFKACDFVGLAYNCQEIKQCPTDAWDLSLDAIITESKNIVFD